MSNEYKSELSPSEDIVEWLRQFKLSTSDSNYNALVVNGKTEEAANEIERLREVIENMTNLSNNLWHIGFTALNGDK